MNVPDKDKMLEEAMGLISSLEHALYNQRPKSEWDELYKRMKEIQVKYEELPDPTPDPSDNIEYVLKKICDTFKLTASMDISFIRESLLSLQRPMRHYTREEVKFHATRFAHLCRLKGVSTNNDTINLWNTDYANINHPLPPAEKTEKPHQKEFDWTEIENVVEKKEINLEYWIARYCLKLGFPQDLQGMMFVVLNALDNYQPKSYPTDKIYNGEDMVQASKYGYEFRATTAFPEHKFEDDCINNTKQWMQHYILTKMMANAVQLKGPAMDEDNILKCKNCGEPNLLSDEDAGTERELIRMCEKCYNEKQYQTPGIVFHKGLRYEINTSETPKPGDLIYSTVSKSVLPFSDPRHFSDGTYFKVYRKWDEEEKD